MFHWTYFLTQPHRPWQQCNWYVTAFSAVAYLCTCCMLTIWLWSTFISNFNSVPEPVQNSLSLALGISIVFLPNKKIDWFYKGLPLAVKHIEDKTVNDCAYKPKYRVKHPGDGHFMMMIKIWRICCNSFIHSNHKVLTDTEDFNLLLSHITKK